MKKLNIDFSFQFFWFPEVSFVGNYITQEKKVVKRTNDDKMKGNLVILLN